MSESCRLPSWTSWRKRFFRWSLSFLSSFFEFWSVKPVRVVPSSDDRGGPVTDDRETVSRDLVCVRLRSLFKIVVKHSRRLWGLCLIESVRTLLVLLSFNGWLHLLALLCGVGVVTKARAKGGGRYKVSVLWKTKREGNISRLICWFDYQNQVF